MLEMIYARVGVGLEMWGAVPDEESRSPFLHYQSEGWKPER